MNKVAYSYRQLLTVLTTRLEEGARNVDLLIVEARKHLEQTGGLTGTERDQVMKAVQRDLEEFARSYEESQQTDEESVFYRVIRESLWQELADITDKTQLEWREIFQDLTHHGVYQSGEVVGLGNLICEKCQFTRGIYTPEILTPCQKCGHDQFQRQPFDP
ncbi:zinc ribbon-containing protein [Enterobacteriaceae bacterium LUAb1]